MKLTIQTVLVALLFFVPGCASVETAPDVMDVLNLDTDVVTDATPPDAANDVQWDLPDGVDPSLCQTATPIDLKGFDPAYDLISSGNPTQDKSFYLLTLLDHVQGIADIINNDSNLATIGTQRDSGLRTALCGDDVGCWETVLRWEPNDIQTVVSRINSLVSTKGITLVVEHMRLSGMFFMYQDKTDAEMIAAAWTETADGLNEALNRFSSKITPKEFSGIIQDVIESSDNFLFYQPLLRVVMSLLAECGRDEAGRYEPMRDGENKAAYKAMPDIEWKAYPFSVMMVPGMGPTEPDVALDPRGVEHCDLVAERWHAGLAPLIITSGGHVSPDRTEYAEAIEMKRYLMEQHGIPETALIVDPHARHTTTNLRNAARIILRYGIPADKPAMTVTDIFQSAYILNLGTRLMEDLGFIPYRSLARMTDNDNCWLAAPESLWVDPGDPLDP